ncbi:MAG TPA: hypothetical protein VFO93_02025 [Hymenobacter sp.]|uniref:hypothetical protein n=1 Tax=Hymenobacter sp. TaxID=1898978 RepID=UPI002D7F0DC0|nr:hypothetical protein [Hymenobacter sp.]HET9502289.1 hypothetical protein [Hymenobacter sp.]
MPTYHTPIYTFTFSYENATHCLLARWHGTVPDADLYAHYAELMATAEAHGYCRWWLLDIRARSWPTPSFRHWMNTEFAPLAQAALIKPLSIAYLIADEQNEHIAQAGIQNVRHNLAGHDVQPAFFNSEAAALAWLAQQQAQDPAG